MIKFLILYALGRKSLSPRSLFNLIKSYLIVYMMILPGLLTANTFEWVKSEPIDFSLNYELVNSPATDDVNGQFVRIAPDESLKNCGQYAIGNTFVRFDTDESEFLSSSRINGMAHISGSVFDSSGKLYLLMPTRGNVFFEKGGELTP